MSRPSTFKSSTSRQSTSRRLKSKGSKSRRSRFTIKFPGTTVRLKLIPTLMLSIFLMLGVSLTYSYLSVFTGAVTNTFTEAKIPGEIVETFDNNVKTDIGYTHSDESNADVYVRIKSVLQVLDEDGNVVATPSTYYSDGTLANLPLTLENAYSVYFYDGESDEFSFNLDNWSSDYETYLGHMNTGDWLIYMGQTGTRSVAYYKYPLSPGDSTSNLIDVLKQDLYFEDGSGYTLHLTFLSEAIQLAAIGEWSLVDVDESGNLVDGDEATLYVNPGDDE